MRLGLEALKDNEARQQETQMKALTKIENSLIQEIADRAIKHDLKVDKLTLMMDLTALTPSLNLGALVNSRDGDFFHDIIGIPSVMGFWNRLEGYDKTEYRGSGYGMGILTVE